MGHTSPEKLQDLKTVLNDIRKWEGIKETAKNVFYYKSTPFLHFHDSNGERWADVRDGEAWGKSLTISFDASSRDMNNFLKEIRKRYERSFSKAKSKLPKLDK